MEQYDASVVVSVCTLAKGCTHIYYQRGVFIQFIYQSGVWRYHVFYAVSYTHLDVYKRQ